MLIVLMKARAHAAAAAPETFWEHGVLYWEVSSESARRVVRRAKFLGGSLFFCLYDIT